MQEWRIGADGQYPKRELRKHKELPTREIAVPFTCEIWSGMHELINTTTIRKTIHPFLDYFHVRRGQITILDHEGIVLAELRTLKWRQNSARNR
jgi:hypothetical protein